MNPDKKQFTWRRKNNVDKSRIDYWLIENNIIPLLLTTDIRPAIIKYTDHMAISIKLKTPLKRGPGFWKLNNTYLNDPEYCRSALDIINQCKELNIENSMTKWKL